MCVDPAATGRTEILSFFFRVAAVPDFLGPAEISALRVLPAPAQCSLMP